MSVAEISPQYAHEQHTILNVESNYRIIIMKKLVLVGALLLTIAGIAEAADMPLKAAPLPVHWTGCYFGVNLGGAWSNSHATPGSFTSNGFVDFAGREAQGEFSTYDFGGGGFTGGGQLGCNYQVSSSWVIGVETDFNGTTLSQLSSFAFPTTAAFNTNTQSASQSLSWLGTVRGRLGYLVTPSWLVFATGGLAYGQVDNTVSTVGVPDGFAGTTVAVSSNSNRTGYTAGGGVEYAISNKWTAKLEYLYYDLGSETLLLNYASLPGGVGNAINYTFTEKGNIVRLGLNLRF